MKIAVIGAGKTGSIVLELIDEAELVGPFSSRRPASLAELAKADVAIVFVPGEGNLELIELCLEARLPTVWGSTGFLWPQDLDERLGSCKLTWIRAANFSLGIAVARHVLRTLSVARGLWPAAEASICETHHAEKKDAPSGTALAWCESFGAPAIPIESKREGDTVGTHALTLKTKSESLEIRHQALSRELFAEGAVLAARELASGGYSEPGLHDFDELLNYKLGALPCPQ